MAGPTLGVYQANFQPTGTTLASGAGVTTQVSGSTFVCIGYSNNVTGATVTDNKGNTWPTSPAATVPTLGTGGDMVLFVLPNGAGGAGHIVTLNCPSSIYTQGCELIELKGSGGMYPQLDASAVNAVYNSSGAGSCPVTTTKANELVISAVRNDQGAPSSTVAPAGGFSAIESFSGLSYNEYGSAQLTVATSGTTVNPAWTSTYGVDNAVITAGFYLAAVGPAAPTYLWPGPFDSYNFAFSWWPSSDTNAQTYNVYNGATQIATGIIPGPTWYYTAAYQLFKVVSGLSPNTTYNFYVSSVNSLGVEGPLSAPLTVTTLSGVAGATLPAAPLSTYTPAYSLPGGLTWTCTAHLTEISALGTAGSGMSGSVGCSLQYAFLNASYGDVIQCVGGGGANTYVNNQTGSGYTIPTTWNGSSANGPVYWTTSLYSSLPAPGTQVAPADVAHMALVKFGNASSGCGGWGVTIGAAGGYLRAVGIAIVPVASDTTSSMYGCVQFITSNIGAPVVPAQNVCFDRCYMGNSFANFGTTWSMVYGGIVNLNCSNFNLNCCYLEGFGSNANEGHGVAVSGGSVHTYTNSYVEAVSEAVLYGGGYVGQAYIPSDVTADDYCTFCQPAGIATATSPNVANWAKNNFELKVGIRVQVSGCKNQLSIAGVRGSQKGRSFVIGCRDNFCAPNYGGASTYITSVSISGPNTIIGYSGASWATNQWAQQWICDLWGIFPCAVILSNTANTLTFATAQQWGDVVMYVGDAFVITNPPTWQCPWNVVEDVNLFSNLVNDTGPLANVFNADYSPTAVTRRIRVQNNQGWSNCPQYTDPVYGLQKPNGFSIEVSGCVQDLTLDRNTVVMNIANAQQTTYSCALYYGSTGAWNTSDRLNWVNSMLDGENMFGDGIGGGFSHTAFAADFTNAVVNKNLMFNASVAGFPGTNYGSIPYSSAGMVNFASVSTAPNLGDYDLSPSSTYYAVSTLGGPIGSFFPGSGGTAIVLELLDLVAASGAATLFPLTYPLWPSALPGVTISQTRAYEWKTAVQEGLSGKESRLQLRQYPRVRFGLTFELLRDNLTPSELKSIQGLFNAVAGQYGGLLYTDPTFNTVSNYQFGTGDGTTSTFLITATNQNTLGPGAPELIQQFNGAPKIYVGGSLQTAGTAYNIGAALAGQIVFTGGHIPASAAALTWSGSFFYLVRFDEDELEFTQFMYQWWQSKAMPLLSIKL